MLIGLGESQMNITWTMIIEIIYVAFTSPPSNTFRSYNIMRFELWNFIFEVLIYVS